MHKNKSEFPRVAITCGDLNGIGMEVIIKTMMDNRILSTCIPIVYGNAKAASFYRKLLKVPDFSFNIINHSDEANPKRANLINCWSEEADIVPGQPSVKSGAFAFTSIEAAAKDLAAGKVDLIVTAPIDKKTIQSPEFTFPGHTEYFTQMSNVKESLMLLVSNNLRVGTVTGHVPLKDIVLSLTKEKIVDKIRLLNQTLIKDFGIIKPRIAVLGLNPHAGDGGLLGDEEKNIIDPAIIQCKEKEGILAFGPYPADGFFGSNNLLNFDAVLAMYHDQGLTPFKALAFETGVNFTAGLPIVRTSPDHGTAYNIAGEGIADENSFRHAIYLGCDIWHQRNRYKEMNANKLQTQAKVEKE